MYQRLSSLYQILTKAGILRLSLVTVFAICFLNMSNGQMRPFPQSGSYPGVIKPSVDQTTMNNTVASYYDYWVNKYLKPTTMAGGYYVHGDCTGCQVPSKGTSEGHGYGMILSALMAGHDANAQTHFNGLYKFFDTHRSTINNELMGWNVAVDERTNAFSSATDGDMDIAYALLLAHYQWGSTSSEINYLQEAIDMINLGLKGGVVNTTTFRTMLGDWDNDQYSSRPSDWMTGHFQAYKAATGDVFWDQVSSTTYGMINSLHSNASANTGLVPDFVVNNPAVPAPAYFLEGPNDGNYYYNACRYPLRIAMDYVHYGTPDSKTALNKLLNWIKPATNNNPMNILPGYKMDGSSIGANYDDAVFIAPIVAACAVDANHQAYLDAGWSQIINMKVNYFSDTYNLLCMLFMTGNWWAPVGNIGNLPPSIEIIEPKPGDVYYDNQQINFIINVSDADGTVTQVEYFHNGTSLGIDNSPPYGYTFPSLPAGIHTLAATATDDSNATASASVTFEVIPYGTNPPTAEITTPTEGTIINLGTDIIISANAADQDGSVSKVDFYHGTTLIDTDLSAPYSVTWTNAPVGSYSLTAVATDNLNYTGTSAPVNIQVVDPGSCTAPQYIPGGDFPTGSEAQNNGTLYECTVGGWCSSTSAWAYEPGVGAHWEMAWREVGPCGNPGTPPEVTIISPTNNTTIDLGQSLVLEASANDSDGNVVRVEFYDNGELIDSDLVTPYSITWVPQTAGEHILTAKAYDNDNLDATSAPVSVLVTGPIQVPPTAAITAPVNNTTYKDGDNILIEATADDVDGNVVKVDFYANNALIGSDNSFPYSYNWSSVPVGNYELIAIATDNDQMTGSSTPINVIVETLPPIVILVAPSEGAIFNLSDPVSLQAEASHPNGTVAQVEFFVNGISVGTDLSAPYTETWISDVTGFLPVYAEATLDNGSKHQSATATIEVKGTSLCTAPPWERDVVYDKDTVSHNGHEWYAKWWTRNQEPGTTGEWGVWKDLGPCSGAKAASLTINEVQVYPVPFKEKLHIDLSLREDSEVHINIISATGAVAIAESYALTAGKQSIQIDTQKLQSGLYIYTIRTNSGTFTKNIIKR